MSHNNMMNNLKSLAVSDTIERRKNLLAILQEMQAPFLRYHDQARRRNPENIVVPFPAHHSLPFLVIGAHYDAVPGSTGANDNGTGVCILLEIIQYFLKTPPGLPLKFIFFDMEEGSMAGSEAYLNRVPADKVIGMINLDMCGVGDTIVISPSKNARYEPFQAAIESIKSHHPIIVDEFMPGDNIPFEAAKIPNLALCTLPKEEIPAAMAVWQAMLTHKAPDFMPSVFETIHNGTRDTIAVIQESVFQAAFRCTIELIQQVAQTVNGDVK